MPAKKQSIEERLLAAQVAIDNALSDADIQTYMAEFGYDAQRIGEGKTLYDTTQQLQQKQTAEYGDQFAATDALETARDQANADYMRFVKVARVALKSDRDAFQKLDLDGKRKVSLSGWLAQAKQFYLNALADAGVQTKLADFGITQTKLDAGKALVDAAEAANAVQEKEKGEAQQATLERDQALDNLDGWMSDFTAIARVALEEKPQLLEKLGIFAAS